MDALQQSSSLPSLHVHGSLAAARSPPSSRFLPPSFPARHSLRFNALTSKVPPLSGRGHRAVVCMSRSAASGYAAALADVAKSQNILEAVYEDIQKLGRFLEDKQFSSFINNPILKGDSKKAVIKSLAAEQKFQPVTLNLLSLIIDNRRTAILKPLVKEFELLYNELTDTQVAVVTSAVEIGKSQLSLIGKKIQSMSGSKNVKLKNIIDPSIIAGFIVRFGRDGSRLVDMSVKGQLDRLTYKIEQAEKTAVY